jgi:hypothetical protein
VGPDGVVDTSTSRGRNFCIRSPFGALDTLLKKYSQGVHISLNLSCAFSYMLNVVEPKKRHLGPQNDPGSLGPEKTVKKLSKWKLFFEPVE